MTTCFASEIILTIYMSILGYGLNVQPAQKNMGHISAHFVYRRMFTL